MTALAAPRRSIENEGVSETITLASAVQVWQGGMVALDASDTGIRASADATLRVRGIALLSVLQATATPTVEVDRSTPQWLVNSGTDTIVADDIGSNAYVEDDQTVGNNPAGTCVAGRILAVDATNGVLVHVGYPAQGHNDPVYLAPAADAAVELGQQLHGGLVELNSTTGAKAITTAARVRPGTRVTLYAGTLSGGSYTLVTSGGTLTINAAEETADVMWDGTEWNTLSLLGATLV